MCIYINIQIDRQRLHRRSPKKEKGQKNRREKNEAHRGIADTTEASGVVVEAVEKSGAGEA